MPLLDRFNYRCPETEWQMQEKVVRFLQNQKYYNSYLEEITPTIFTEVHIPEVHRRSDIVVYLSPKRIYNIELKLNDIKGVVKQAIDHLKWADYSYVCLPHNAWISHPEFKTMLDNNIGLITYLNPFEMVEVMFARHNTYKGGKDREIRAAVNKRLESLLP